MVWHCCDSSFIRFPLLDVYGLDRQSASACLRDACSHLTIISPVQLVSLRWQLVGVRDMFLPSLDVSSYQPCALWLTIRLVEYLVIAGCTCSAHSVLTTCDLQTTCHYAKHLHLQRTVQPAKAHQYTHQPRTLGPACIKSVTQLALEQCSVSTAYEYGSTPGSMKRVK